MVDRRILFPAVLIGGGLIALACTGNSVTQVSDLTLLPVASQSMAPSATAGSAPSGTPEPKPSTDDPLLIAAKETVAVLRAQGTQYLSEEFRYYDMASLIRGTLLAATSDVDRQTAVALTSLPTTTMTPLPFVMPRTPTPQAGVYPDPHYLNLVYDGNSPTPEEKAFLDQLYYDCYQRYWEFISFQDGPPGPDFAERLAEYQWTDGNNNQYDSSVPQFSDFAAIVPQYSSYQLTVQYVVWLSARGYYIRQSMVDPSQLRLTWGGYENSPEGPNDAMFNRATLNGPDPLTGRYRIVFDVNQQSNGKNRVRFELVKTSTGLAIEELRLPSPNGLTVCEWDPASNRWKLAVASHEVYAQWRFMDFFHSIGAATTPQQPWTATPRP